MIAFRPAVRENVSLIILLAGGTGSGKTFTGMRLASGIAGDKPFAVIDTENGRAKHYADRFKFDHADLRAPFEPAAYQEAILAADAAGYPVIMVDSGSHEHAGDGGILDMQEAELTRMAGTDWKKREACKMAAWIKPKTEHKHFVQKLLQVKAQLIICLRAEEKVEMVREPDEHGKMRTKILPKKSLTGKDGWIPICEKSLPFEATCSFLLTPDAPGVPKPIKLQEQHRDLFPLDKPITEESGRLLAAWAAGRPSAPAPRTLEDTGATPSLVPTSSAPGRITAEQKAELERACDAASISITKVCDKAKIFSIEEMDRDDFDAAIAWVRKVAASRAPDEAATLRKIESAKDRDAAAEILDTCRSFPFYERLSTAFSAQWGQ